MEPEISPIGVISVIMSGIVAIVSVVTPLIINYYSEKGKWEREKKASQIISIINSTTALLDKLAIFRTGAVQEATGAHHRKVLGETISAFYTWERVLWALVEENDRDSIKHLRKEFEDGSSGTLYDEGPKLADSILKISFNAQKAIKG